MSSQPKAVQRGTKTCCRVGYIPFYGLVIIDKKVQTKVENTSTKIVDKPSSNNVTRFE